MNLSIVSEFKKYLQEEAETTDRFGNTSYADTSIFSNKDKFQDFIKDKYGVNVSVSIHDIYNLEVKDGKLVLDGEDEADAEVLADVSQAIADEEAELAAEAETQLDEVPTETDAAPEAAEGTETAEGTEATEGEEYTSDDMMKEMINEFLSDEKVIKVADTNGDGVLDEEEIDTLLAAVNAYDEDYENLSVDDLFGAYQSIDDGEFDILDYTVDPESVDADEAVSPSVVDPASAGKTYNGGGNYSAGSGYTSKGVKEKTLATMTKEELDAENIKADNDVKEKQGLLNGLLDGTDSELKTRKDNVDGLYDKYQEDLKAVDEELAGKIDTLKQTIDARESAIDAQDKLIADDELELSKATSALQDAETKVSTLQTALDALNSVSEEGLDSDKKAELTTKRTELTKLRDQAIEAKQQAEEAKTAAEQKLNDDKDQRDKLVNGENGEESLESLKSQMADLESQVAQLGENHPELKASFDAYTQAKTELESYKETAVTTAKADLEKSTTYYNEVQTAIKNYDNKQTVKEYNFGAFGEDIVEFAKQFLGYKESDGSANIFLGGSSSSATPWCAAFVEYIMENAGYYDKVADWYKNIDNKWYCPNIYQAAKDANALVGSGEAEAGDVILFDWEANGSKKDHVGIIVSIEDGIVTTIEGNTSDQVAIRTYKIDDPRLTFCKAV